MKTDIRPATPPRRVQVAVALPWTIIAVLAISLGAFMLGWNFRSEQLTITDIQWVVAEQLKEAKK